jgi:DNA-binding response OmpR family regulator
MNTLPKKVLIVDDEEHIRTSIRDILLDEGYSLSLAADADQAMELIPQDIYDIVIMDIQMPGLDGMQALRRIREYCPQTGIIMISGHGTIDNAVESMKLGALEFLQKPFTMQRLKDAVRNLADRPTPVSSSPGGFFGRYEIVREIASGGTAIVWEAMQHPKNRKVALKVLHQHLAMEPNFIRRFQQEATIAASLCHPNIVTVYEHGTSNDRHFIAMEYIDGCSLETLILQRKKPQWHVISGIALSVCAALAYSHDRGVLHRDVKPGNILIAKSGIVKVTDFGFSRMLDGISVRLTQTNRVVGTPLFMAPETISGKQVSFSSDIFSLGIILYMLSCGRPPFAGATTPAVMQSIMECSYVKPRKVNRAIPKKLEKIIVKCLQKDTSARYAGMGAVMNDVKEFLGDCEVGPTENEVARFAHDCVV